MVAINSQLISVIRTTGLSGCSTRMCDCKFGTNNFFVEICRFKCSLHLLHSQFIVIRKIGNAGYWRQRLETDKI